MAVYGTLKKGFSNHHPYMVGATHVTDIEIPGIMFSMMHYPGLILHDSIGVNNPEARAFCLGYKAKAEVYNINEKILESLDRLEGHPSYYMRLPYKHPNLDEVWVYTVKPHIYLRGMQRVVPSGIWDAEKTTIQQVNFGPGHCKPKILAWSGLHGHEPRYQVPRQYGTEDWDDIDESGPLSTVFDSRNSVDTTGTDEHAELEIDLNEPDIIQIDIDGDISAVQEAV